VWGSIPAAIAYWAAHADSKHIVLSVEGLLVGAALVYFAVNSYDDVRDGAKEVAIGLGAFCALVIAWCWACRGAVSVQQATLWTMQIVLAALHISWIILFLFSLAAWALGWWACFRIKRLGNLNRYARARAAVRTSRLALAMPTLAILIVTLAFWSALFVKTSGNSGQGGDSFAVRLFGNSVDELQANTPWVRSFMLPSHETVKGYLGQIPAPFTIKTNPVGKTTPVDITASYMGETQKTTVTLNPKTIVLNLNPTTVVGGTESAGTVTLNDPSQTDKTSVALASSDGAVMIEPKVLTVGKGLSVTPPETAPASSSPKPGSMRPNDFFQGLLVWSATPGFPAALLFMILGFFLLVLWVLPSVFAEINPPVRSENFASIRMGDWLSRGLDATKIVTGLVWCAAFVLLTAFGLFYGRTLPSTLQASRPWMQVVNHFFLSGTAVLLEYIGLAAGSLSILTGLAGSGSAILGIILDVDNYLRTSPKDDTPRARIAERYVSLLRYVSEYRDPSGAGYDRVVIVAHSLGALISADLLRFLKVQRDPYTGRYYFSGAPPAPSQPKIQLRLFTMGNPLRQLLNRFFPYLYEWVRPVPDNSLQPLRRGVNAQAPGIGSSEMPDPNLLEVELWVSAYRSGDYVGRSLWLDEWYDREVPARAVPDKPGPVCVATENPPGLREEMCIGAGAHQHYWDQSAPDIAEKLDELIWS
jgi:hypothetical protein